MNALVGPPPSGVALVMAGDEEGGLEKHVVELANGLAAHGQAVTVVAHPKYADRFEPSVCLRPVQLARGRRNPLALWQLYCALRASGVNIVHAHGNKAAAMVGTLLRWLPVRSVATLHSQKSRTTMFTPFDRVIAVSPRAAMQLAHPAVRVVLNGIEPPQYVNQAQRLPQRGTPIALAVGRLVSIKGYDALIRAWRGLEGQLWIAGDGPEHDALEALIVLLGLQDHVHLLGHRTDIGQLLAQADFLVISSHYEGGPYTLAEALLQRVPVVGAAVGLVPDYVPVRYTCPPQDQAALHACLARALKERKSLEQVFEPSFEKAECTLTLEAMLTGVQAVYEELRRA